MSPLLIERRDPLVALSEKGHGANIAETPADTRLCGVLLVLCSREDWRDCCRLSDYTSVVLGRPLHGLRCGGPFAPRQIEVWLSFCS